MLQLIFNKSALIVVIVLTLHRNTFAVRLRSLIYDYLLTFKIRYMLELRATQI